MMRKHIVILSLIVYIAVSRAAFRKVQMGERFTRRIVGQSDDRALSADLAQGCV